MSNLVKLYNAIEPKQSVRMIDCNAAVEKKLAEIARQQNGDESIVTEGFQTLDSIVEEAVLENPADVLRDAKEEAEEILRHAQEEADRLLTSAKEQYEEILESAREIGHKEGYDTGFSEIKEKLEEEYEQRNVELEQLKSTLQEEHDKEMQMLEPKLLDVILTVVGKVFHIQFEDKKEIILHLVNDAIANIEGCKNFRIRVGHEQKSFLEYHKDTILERIGNDMTLEIIADSSIEGNQCVIETETGIFDCSLGVQFENLVKDLKSLSS